MVKNGNIFQKNIKKNNSLDKKFYVYSPKNHI